MANLKADIAAFERMRPRLEADHLYAWALFHEGVLVDTFLDFEAAATFAVDRFDNGPYLIRQIGAGPVKLTGGMVFRPSQAVASRHIRADILRQYRLAYDGTTGDVEIGDAQSFSG